VKRLFGASRKARVFGGGGGGGVSETARLMVKKKKKKERRWDNFLEGEKGRRGEDTGKASSSKKSMSFVPGLKEKIRRFVTKSKVQKKSFFPVTL